MKNNELNMLVGMLHQASKLEHCLLDTYLYTASTIKSLPEEFALLSNGKPNLRRAIQFEKARQWKQSILGVSHEEMMHLHYVQCLLRALDESPSFALPDRKKDTGNWFISNWDIYQPGDTQDEGTEIPLEGLTSKQIKQFILFESTDSLQDSNPFGDQNKALFQKLYEFELDFHLEGILYNIADQQKRDDMKKALNDIYLNLAPSDEGMLKAALLEALPDAEEDLKYVRFQSIGDFYTKGILPLYQQAFDTGKVKNSNLGFNNEMQGFAAGEGFLPVGPVYRSKNYTEFSTANAQHALRYFKNVESIVNEIVEEGEGFEGFETTAERFLAKVTEIGGTRHYLDAWKKDKRNARTKGYSTPQWLADAELCRQSHLYRFAMIYMDMEFEQQLCKNVGTTFSANRDPLTIDMGNHSLKKLVTEMPKQFNACYLVMLSWLSRIYEVKLWETDKDRRLAIEMIATWPMMSLSIRPFLELISFFPVDLKAMFRLDKDALPGLPTDATQLADYFSDTERSETINKQIDYLALRVLANVADWAREQIEVVKANFSGYQADMIITRLSGLSRLNEFEKQFPFREHGGYSNTMPDLNYQQQFPDAGLFSENPSMLGQEPKNPNEQDRIFEDTLVLKLRFGGFGLVQLSTDPDPPTDESGCTGTHMLHAADGELTLDRALVWQDLPGQKNILREPRKKLPTIGVNIVDLTLQVTAESGATAGYMPLQIMQSTGAVQTSGVQQYLDVNGLNDLVKYDSSNVLGAGNPVRLNLLEKDGIRPFLNGDNHLVSKDGEPIDPFIISVTDDQHQNIFQREIYNEGKTLLEMDPLQRVETSRWPTGFDSNLDDIPAWLIAHLPTDYTQAIMQGPPAYLGSRANVLYDELNLLLNDGAIMDQNKVDQLISFTERLFLITVPRGTTMGWLAILLNYGHSVSGIIKSSESNNPIYDLIERELNIKVSCLPEEKDRTKANSRWVVKYTKGIMDTDAITDLVYGELYIPLQVIPDGRKFNIKKKWVFAPGMKDLVAGYTCDFSKPFWATFMVEGKVRSIVLPSGIEIIETLADHDTYSYSYTATGVPGIDGYTGAFKVSVMDDSHVELLLEISFGFENTAAFKTMATIVGGFFSSTSTALNAHFSPEQ
jgi:Ferritin-like